MRRDSGGFYGSGMADEFSQRYADLVSGSYDCVDRIVLNAYFSLGHNPGGFRVWWRRLHNNFEEDLDDTHLMRMAGRFSHEWVACQAQTAGIGYTKEGDCFTAVADPQALAQVADTLSQPATAGHLSQVCERWIYSACLCFGLDADEQARSGFRYAYSVYQVEYSRNLLFGSGAQMDRVFNTLVDRTRSRLDVPTLRTLFGA